MTGFVIGFALGCASAAALWAASWLAGQPGAGPPFPASMPRIHGEEMLPPAMDATPAPTMYPDWPTGGFDAAIFGRRP